MGLFDKLFGGGDPSAKWRRDPALALEADLDAATLAGVKLGSRIDGLSRLGAPSTADAAEGLYAWSDLWVEARLRKGLLAAYTFRWEPACAATFVRAGKRLPLGASTSDEQLAALLGAPWHVYADPDDPEAPPVFFYATRLVEWELQLGRSGGLVSLTVASPPTLVDPGRRRELRVEKPWPP